MLVTFDTNLLIWGVRGVSSEGQEEMIVRAKALIDWLDKHDDRLVLTSVCIGEYLIGNDPEKRKLELFALQEKHMIYPYDANAAAIVAELRSDYDFLYALKADARKTRVAIKADIEIVATAKAFRIECIYSNDATLRKIAAKCGLSARDVPSLEEITSWLSAPVSPTLEPTARFRARSLFDDDESDEV